MVYANINNRWVYKRLFVADGNFKADHVRQKTISGDVWLSEGSGIIPKREEYQSFLRFATERLTVSLLLLCRLYAGSGLHLFTRPSKLRKLHAKISSVLS